MANYSGRFASLDALRGLTVILAMLDHAKVQFVSDLHVFVPLTRLATPCFIILFGAMIEIAYLSKLRSGSEIRSVRERMAARLITCWALAILLTIAAVISGNLDVETAWRSTIGMGLGRFNEILLIYAALFAILIAMLPILARHGAVPILAVAIVGWLSQPVLAAAFPNPVYLLNFFLGVGVGYGPALLPALTFLGFGLALGETLTGRRGVLLAVLVVVLAAVVCASELSYGLLEFGRRFLANRWINHPGYYAVGIIGFVGIWGALLVAKRIRFMDVPLRGLARVGTQSLFVYGAGNLFLNLLPVLELPRAIGIVVAFLFLAGLVTLSLVGPSKRNIFGMGLPARWGQEYGKVRDYMVGRLLPKPV